MVIPDDNKSFDPKQMKRFEEVAVDAIGDGKRPMYVKNAQYVAYLSFCPGINFLSVVGKICLHYVRYTHRKTWQPSMYPAVKR